MNCRPTTINYNAETYQQLTTVHQLQINQMRLLQFINYSIKV